MTDVTQGQDDDSSLFSDATSTTLEKFENAEPLTTEKPPLEKAAEKPVVEPAKAVEPPKLDAPEAPVPAGRLREEAERARRAERERDDLMRQLAAMRQPQSPPPKPDLFENPSGFVQSEVRPYFDQVTQQIRAQTEAFSELMATSAYGSDKVQAAKQALVEGMHRGDPDVKAVYDRAINSPHPFDVIARWHLNNETMREVGGDLAAYKKRVLEEALKDPDHQRQVFEYQRSGGNAQHVARPVTSSPVPKIPSLGTVGTGAGGEADLQESDDQLFRAATSAKRR
jgi:hypothetical protein